MAAFEYMFLIEASSVTLLCPPGSVRDLFIFLSTFLQLQMHPGTFKVSEKSDTLELNWTPIWVLNGLGAAGWEVISVDRVASTYRYVLKRRVA